MKSNISVLFVLLFIIMMPLFSACSGADDNNASSVSPSSSEPADADLSASSSLTGGEDGENTESNEPQRVRIDADGGLRMRSGPGTEYEIIRVIPQYEYAQLSEAAEDHPDWVYVYYDGDYGWISTEFISYETDTVSASNWVEVYYDYLSAFEAVTYTSTLYGGQYVVSSHVVDGEIRGSNVIEFWNVEGYAYPVLISNEIPIDADGNTDVPLFIPTAYLIEGKNVREADESERSSFFKASVDGPGLDVKGNLVTQFVLKPENGGSPENVQEALKWLKAR